MSKIEGLNSERCDRRRSIAATRFGVDAVPMRFRGSSVAEANKGWSILKSEGEIPKAPEDALALINALLPPGSEMLAPEDVYLHIYEAANSNFVSDRSLFLAESTLRNIGNDATTGVSFMNSHRTGDMSSPAEMPYGQSFAGEYQEGIDEDGNPSRRALVAVYMARNLKPNGASGPSTDDLNRMFTTGSIKDVSVGLRGGSRLCDVCGYAIGYGEDAYKNGRKLCKHRPGSTRNMTDEQIGAQKTRDARNAKGVASYSLHDSRLGELSAVYDGAVPGAGIRQVLSLAKSGEFSQDEVREMLTEAVVYYREQFDFDLTDIVEIKGKNPKFKTPVPKGSIPMSKLAIVSGAIATALAPYFGGGEHEDDDAQREDAANNPPANVTPPVVQPPAVPTGLSAKDRADLERFRAQESENNRNEGLRRERAKTEDFSKFQVELASKVTPATAPKGQALFLALQAADEKNPVACERLALNEDGSARLGSDGQQVVEKLSHVDLLREFVGSLDNNFALGEVPAPDQNPEVAKRFAASSAQSLPVSEEESLAAAAKAEAREWVEGDKKPGAKA